MCVCICICQRINKTFLKNSAETFKARMTSVLPADILYHFQATIFNPNLLY